MAVTKMTSETGTRSYITSGATPEWTGTGSQSLHTTGQEIYATSQATTLASAEEASGTPTVESSAATMSASEITPTPTTANVRHHEGMRLDHNAIIAGSVVGLLLIAVLLAGFCLVRAKRTRRRGGVTKTPSQAQPAAASAAAVREPNPYSNACFDATNEEMAEKTRPSREPAKSAAESVNSIRNKEETWIIPMEELAEDDATANFDTTKF